MYLVVELHMGFQHVAFTPSCARFYTAFLKNCDRGESLGIATCLKTVVGGKHGHAPCKDICSNTVSFM